MPEISEVSLEQTFSDLANSRLRDKSPALLDYIAGFELLESEEDGARAVGVFGCEIGENWYYVPVFFLNGEIKGLNSLYSVENDLFVPLTESFVNQVISRRDNQLGDADTRSRSERGVRNPDYVRLRQLPSGSGGQLTSMSLFGMGKSASDVAAARRGLLAKMAGARTTSVHCTIPEALKSLHPKLAADVAYALTHGKLGELSSQFYDAMELAFSAPETRQRKLAEDLVIVSQVGAPGCEELTDAQREKVVAGGTAVVDKRPGVTKSIVYATETESRFQNPTEGGLYECLMSDGAIKPIYCLKVTGGLKDRGLLAIDPEDDRAAIIPGRKILAVRQQNPEAFRTAWEKDMIPAERVKPGDCVVFVNANGEASIPVEIESVLDGQDNIKVLKAREYWVSVDDAKHCNIAVSCGWGRPPWDYGTPAERTKEVLVTDAGGSDPRYTATRLILNRRNFRAYVLNHVTTKKSDNGWDDRTFDTYPEKARLCCSDFGDHQTVRAELKKVASELKVWTTDHGVVIRVDDGRAQEFSKTAAFEHLLREHWMSEDDAALLVKSANKVPNRYFVKRAGPEALLPYQDPQDTADGGLMSSYHMTQIPLTTEQRKPSDDNRDFYRYHSPFGGADDEGGGQGQSGGNDTMEVIQNAAQTGQRDVFDVAVLGSLLKSKRAPDMVERFLPTIVSGMDRLGRLDFLMNWHYDEFKERYGDQDIAEFQENVLSTYESLGDLVDFMKRRTLAGDPESYGLALPAGQQE